VFLLSLRRLLSRLSRRRAGGCPAAPPGAWWCRPDLEILEDRTVPSTIAWRRPVSGDWDNPANWVGGQVPTAGDVAVIPFAKIQVTHATAAADAVQRLLSEAAIKLSAGSLSVGDPALQTAATTSRIDNLFSVTGSGTLSLADVTLNGSGTLANSATVNLGFLTTLNVGVQNTAGVLTDNGTIHNSAAQPFVNGPNATLAVPSGANFANGFTNQGLIKLGTTNNFGGSLGIAGGTLVNAAGGTIDFLQISSRRRSTIATNVDNRGTITAEGNAGLGGNGGTVINSGTITVSAFGNLTVTNSTFTNTGTITVGGRGLTVFGGTFNQNGSLGGSGTLTLSGATGNFTGNVSNAMTPLALQGATFNVTGTLTNVGTLHIGGSTINAPLVNQGTLISDGANTSINGAFTNAAGATLVVEGSFVAGGLTIAQGFTNHGSIQLSSIQFASADTTLTVANGTLTNAAGATIASVFGGNGGGRFLNARLVNQGTVTIAQPAEFTGTLTNSGTLDVQSDLTVNLTGTAPSLVNTGTVTVASLQSLGVEGGDFANSGSVALGSFGIVQVTGNYTQTAGTTNLGGGILTANGVHLEGGVLVGPGTIDADVQNAATVDVGAPGSPGILSIGGNYIQTGSGVLKVQIGGTSAGVTFDQLDVTGQAALNGTLTVNLINGFVPTSGKSFEILTSSADTGAFTILNGAGGQFTPHFDASDVTLVAK
jgi:hypothetical protein